MQFTDIEDEIISFYCLLWNFLLGSLTFSEPVWAFFIDCLSSIYFLPRKPQTPGAHVHSFLAYAFHVFGTKGDGCFWQMYRIKVAFFFFYPQKVSFSEKGCGEVNRNFSPNLKQKLSVSRIISLFINYLSYLDREI